MMMNSMSSNPLYWAYMLSVLTAIIAVAYQLGKTGSSSFSSASSSRPRPRPRMIFLRRLLFTLRLVLPLVLVIATHVEETGMPNGAIIAIRWV